MTNTKYHKRFVALLAARGEEPAYLNIGGVGCCTDGHVLIVLGKPVATRGVVGGNHACVTEKSCGTLAEYMRDWSETEPVAVFIRDGLARLSNGLSRWVDPGFARIFDDCQWRVWDTIGINARPFAVVRRGKLVALVMSMGKSEAEVNL